MTKAVNIVKLCVGAEGVEDLERWQESQRGRYPAGLVTHVTRMWPKREAEILGDGSLYWVMKGVIQARQRVVGLEEVDHGDGIRRCGILLDPEVIRTQTALRRPFQGWRYLDPKDAPGDLAVSRAGDDNLPPGLAEALASFGVR